MLVLRQLITVYDARLNLPFSIKTTEIQIILHTTYFAIFDFY
jgi:hypothetical protein